MRKNNLGTPAVMFTITIVVLLTSASSAYANSLKALKVSGLGVSVDYARGIDFNDTGCYLSYRWGFAHVVSAFLCADVGYRFLSKNINSRIGGSFLFIFMGLEAGFIASFRLESYTKHVILRDKEIITSPGVFIGLSGVIPGDTLALFLSAGGNFYFINHDHEFYILITGLVNFSGF